MKNTTHCLVIVTKCAFCIGWPVMTDFLSGFPRTLFKKHQLRTMYSYPFNTNNPGLKCNLGSAYQMFYIEYQFYLYLQPNSKSEREGKEVSTYLPPLPHSPQWVCLNLWCSNHLHQWLTRRRLQSLAWRDLMHLAASSV